MGHRSCIGHRAGPVRGARRSSLHGNPLKLGLIPEAGDRREITVVLCAFLILCGLAAFLVGRDLRLPGVYDDEVVQAEPAAQFLNESGAALGIRGARAVNLFGRRFPFMTQPYMGALKSQALIPVFAVFGADTVVLRTTTLVWSLFGVLLIMLWARRLFGLPAALLTGLLLAVDPSILWVSRHDFGSFALGFFCRCGALCALTSGWVRRSSVSLLTGGLLAGLGIYNKIDFAVFVAAAGVALLLSCPRLVADAVRTRRRALACAGLGFGLGVAPLVAALGEALAVTHHYFLIRSSGRVGWRENLETLSTTLDGSNFHSLMLAGGNFGAMFNAEVVHSPFLAIFVVCWVALAGRQICAVRLGKHDGAETFLLLLTLLCVLGILLTPRAVRIHHAMNLYPFPQLVVAIVAVGLWARPAPGRNVRRATAALLVGVALAGGLAVDLRTLRMIQESGGKGMWSDARLRFAEELREVRPLPILVSLDWGFYWSLQFAARGLDVVDPIWELKDRQQRGKTWTFEGSPRHVYLIYPPEYGVFDYGVPFLDAVRRLPPGTATIRSHEDRAGDLAFLSVQIGRPHRLSYGRRVEVTLE